MSPETIALYLKVSHGAVAALLALSVIVFVTAFLIPAWRVGFQLRRTTRDLAQLKQQGPVLDLQVVADGPMQSSRLKHCWSEFRDTLHPQHGTTTTGEQVVARWRATALASSFFSEQVLVDTPLRTEFFKHLPGILTGLGSSPMWHCECQWRNCCPSRRSCAGWLAIWVD